MCETARHHRSIRVPGAQAPAVLQSLVGAYAVRADALATAAEDALDAVGWHADPAGLVLSGPAGLVREVLYGALLAAVDACGERCREYEAGRVGRDALAAAVGDVGVLHRLFAEIEVAEAL